MAMHDLTGFQRDLLYVIAGLSQPSGQEVRRRLHETTDLDVSQGQLYANLNALVDAGLVQKGRLDRRTNFYVLSSPGREAIEARHEWERRHLPAGPWETPKAADSSR